MVVFELLLAHLLGDFVFQSNDLIHRKYKSWTGVLEHVLIIAFFTTLFLFPFWNQAVMWQSVAIIFGTHFLQDLLKIEVDIRFNAKRKSTLPFFADQAFHTALILYLAPRFETLTPMALPTWLNNLYFSQFLTVYLIGLILFSYTYDITVYQFARRQSKKPMEYKPNFAGMRKRILLYSITFVVFLLVHRSLM